MMIFRNTEHYPYFEDDELCEEKECLICYNNIKHCLIIQNICNLDCECYKLIHETCLQTWYNTNNSCPICRKHINKKNNISFEIIKSLITFLLIVDLFLKFVIFTYVINLLINKVFHILLMFLNNFLIKNE